MASLPGWFETADISNYAQSVTISNTNLAIFVPISLDEAPNNPTCTEIRLRSNTVGGTYKLALYNDSAGVPGSLVAGSDTAISGVGTDSFFSLVINQVLAQGTYWLAVKGNNGGGSQPNIKADINAPAPTGHTEPVARFGTAAYANSWPASAPSTSAMTDSWPYAGIYLLGLIVTDTGAGADTRTVTASLSVADTGQGTEARSLTISPLSIADTGHGTELLSRNIPDAGSASDAIAVSASLTITETGRGDDGLNKEGQVTILDNSATATEVIAAPLQIVTDSGGVDPESGEVVTAPLFPITDTATGTDVISRPILDTGAGNEAITVSVALPTIIDAAQGNETITVTGNTPTPPGAAATGGLDAKHVLRLIYGNDKRNPVRTLDLAETAEGHIFLQSGGFTPQSGETIELWSGSSIRFEGQRKLNESRDNSKLSVVYDLANGSQAGLSALQRAINRFFLEAKTYAQFQQNERVWLEYRWSDSLATLPRPKFGQLSYYYEIYAAKAPKWPSDLHSGMLLTGNVLGATLEVTGSPAPEGLEQRAGRAGGTITLHQKGVLIASGASSRLHWPGYTSSGLTGEFSVSGWITLNATWSSGTKDIFDYYVSASNRIRIQYDAGNTRFVITKIVAGTTFTANSSSFTIANGDDVHLLLVQDATTLRLYVNGTQLASVTATATMTDGGLMALGCPAAGTIDGIDVILDGWRIFPDDLTSSQATQLYAAELPVKQRSLQVGPPPYFWTKDADNALDNVDDSSRDNWGILGGVGGDIEAKSRIVVTWTTTYGRDLWLGIKAQDSTFTPSNYLWSEFSNLTNQADSNFSGGSYRSGTITTQSQGLTAAQTGLTSTLLFDRYRVLTRLYASNSITAEMWWRFGANSSIGRQAYNIGKKVTIDPELGPWQLVDLGDVQIGGNRNTAPTGYGININLELISDISEVIEWTGGGDFVFLLPHPYAKIVDAGDSWSASPYPYSLSIEDGLAYATDTSANFSYVGEPIRPIPQRYNYLFLMQVENSSNEFQTGETATMDVYVTPRYLLPGGMVS